MKPSIGRIVHYRLSAADVGTLTSWHRQSGAQGSPIREGQVVAMIITAVALTAEQHFVNGQCFLDGELRYWVKGADFGEMPGTWSWPPREEASPMLGVRYGDRI